MPRICGGLPWWRRCRCLRVVLILLVGITRVLRGLIRFVCRVRIRRRLRLRSLLVIMRCGLLRIGYLVDVLSILVFVCLILILRIIHRRLRRLVRVCGLMLIGLIPLRIQCRVRVPGLRLLVLVRLRVMRRVQVFLRVDIRLVRNEDWTKERSSRDRMVVGSTRGTANNGIT